MCVCVASSAAGYSFFRLLGVVNLSRQGSSLILCSSYQAVGLHVALLLLDQRFWLIHITSYVWTSLGFCVCLCYGLDCVDVCLSTSAFVCVFSPCHDAQISQRDSLKLFLLPLSVLFTGSFTFVHVPPNCAMSSHRPCVCACVCLYCHTRSRKHHFHVFQAPKRSPCGSGDVNRFKRILYDFNFTHQPLGRI